MNITRTQVQDKIRTLTNIEQSKSAYKTAIEAWLVQINASELEKKQILNDLESYLEYSQLKG